MASDLTPPRPAPPVGAPIRLVPTRRPAREVAIGDVLLGGEHPVVVQSMTTTRTADAAATAAQVVRLARAGSQIVRVTVPSRPDADALPEIRRLVRAEGVSVPLVADIHFTPKLALAVLEHVEKVRINPGNFADRKALDGRAYDQARFERDLERVYELFAPVVDRAKQLGVAMRIGTNHGSLSDRIVERHGDTPEGMVESALEFVRICEDRGYRDIVISMKASNTQVMTRTYRLLVERLDVAHEPYPLHLGVTEAGGGDEGRMKSAAGIAVLLAEGLGDTVRVSLTEDPVAEIPVARELVELFAVPRARREPEEPPSLLVERRDALDPLRRECARVDLGAVALGGEEPLRVELAITPETERQPLIYARPPVELAELEVVDAASLDAALYALERLPGSTMARALLLRGEGARALLANDAERARRVRALTARLGFVVEPEDDLASLAALAAGTPLLFALPLSGSLAERETCARVERFAERVAGVAPGVVVTLEPSADVDVIHAYRLLAAALEAAGSRAPIVLTDAREGSGDPRLGLTGRLAALLLDGIGDAVRAPAGEEPRVMARLLHDLLQASRRRLEKAEFIACPSCGRTLFDLEVTTERIRKLTAHLKLKIGVMGCVVNGPGEMADADYGYVGWGEGKVALFVGREMVARDIPSAEAPGRLVDLIRERGDWIDPPEDEEPGAGTSGDESPRA